MHTQQSNTRTPAVVNHDERRTDPRFSVVRSSKIFREQTHQFEPACTRNVSRTGALVDLRGERPVGVGERIEFVVAWTDQALLHRESMTPGIVVRADQLEPGVQRVAIRYDAPEPPHVVLEWAHRPAKPAGISRAA